MWYKAEFVYWVFLWLCTCCCSDAGYELSATEGTENSSTTKRVRCARAFGGDMVMGETKTCKLVLQLLFTFIMLSSYGNHSSQLHNKEEKDPKQHSYTEITYPAHTHFYLSNQSHLLYANSPVATPTNHLQDFRSHELLLHLLFINRALELLESIKSLKSLSFLKLKLNLQLPHYKLAFYFFWKKKSTLRCGHVQTQQTIDHQVAISGLISWLNVYMSMFYKKNTSPVHTIIMSHVNVTYKYTQLIMSHVTSSQVHCVTSSPHTSHVTTTQLCVMSVHNTGTKFVLLLW